MGDGGLVRCATPAQPYVIVVFVAKSFINLMELANQKLRLPRKQIPSVQCAPAGAVYSPNEELCTCKINNGFTNVLVIANSHDKDTGERV